MILPKELEELAERKIWVCHPMIWNPEKHNRVGGYDKPPINPRTLGNAYTNNPDTLSTFDKAAAQIGKTARVRVKGKIDFIVCEVVGVGIALSGTGLFGFDADNVTDYERRLMTSEAHEIMNTMQSYTELSPSGTGIHILARGTIPEGIKRVADRKPDIFGTMKAEYQIFNSGYMTISGETIGKNSLIDGTEALRAVCEKYFSKKGEQGTDTASKTKSSRRSSAPFQDKSGYFRERWLQEIASLSPEEILQRIFKSGSTGRKVQRLYSGDISDYGNDHSRADQALCSLLFCFTDNRSLTEQLFKESALFREHGKSSVYLRNTLNKAGEEAVPLSGHIEFTKEDRRKYAQEKEREENEAFAREHGYNSIEEWMKTGFEKMRNRRNPSPVVS